MADNFMSDSMIPPEEHCRLAALYALNQLDRPEEERFDRITRLARRLFGVQIAAVSLLDSERVFFRSIDGMDAREVSRDGAFCSVTIRQDQPLVVEDADADSRFAQSPIVTGEPRIRFYAGVPLSAPDGSRVATLCIFDPEPRGFTADDVQSLKDLAAVASAELNASWWGEQASHQEARALESQSERRRAEDATRAKTQFLAHMSHEIRTPLNGVLGMLQLLQVNDLGADQRTQVDIALRSGEHLLHLIDDVLDLSRIEAGQVRLQPETHDIHRLGEEVLELIGSEYRSATDVPLSLQIAPGVPQHASVDGLRLKQVLINLLANAQKFTKSGFVELRMDAVDEAEEGRDWLVFEVEDTGTGMGPDQLPRIFKPFVQSSSGGSGRIIPGSGLGLAITRRLVTTMGGKIQVRSQPDEGTVFTVSIPLVRARPQEATMQTTTNEARETGPLQILVVDDDGVSGMVATAFLERDGHQVARAETGKEALERLRQERFDLVFMDIGLPDIDGMEVAITAREQIPDLPPIIALTAYAMEEDRKAFLAAGMAAHVEKPVRVEVLQRTMTEVLATRQETAAASSAVHAWNIPNLCERLQQDDGLIRNLLTSFVADLPGMLQGMDQALESGDRMALIRLAHRLRGQFGNLCVAACENQARELEYHALGATLPALEERLELLRRAIDQVMPEFDAVLSDSSQLPICR